MKVLTYKPLRNRNEFLDYTEKTVHTDHGKMYLIRTDTGHEIKVTDDHSLTTVGNEDFFAPLPPAEALGKFVPVVMNLAYDASADSRYSEKFMRTLFNKNTFKLEDYMLLVSPGLLNMYFFKHLPKTNWQYTPKNEKDRELVKLLLSRANLYYQVDKKGVVKVKPGDMGKIPQDGKLVSRDKARPTNTYKFLPYTWAVVKEVREIPREEVTYDFTVPEFPLFIGNSILVYDTMQVHVPATEEARAEAIDKMLPSKNLFSVRTLEPMMLPQQESVYGIFQASQPDTTLKPVRVDDVIKLRQQIEGGIIKPNAPVTYKGHTTTAGLVLVNDLMPENLQDYKSVWSGPKMKKALSALGKANPAQYTKAADGIKELGALFSYQLGASFKAEDFDLHDLKQKRDAHFAEVNKRMAEIDKSKIPDKDKYTKKVELLREAQSFAQKLTDNAKDNAFHKWAYSGSKGSNSQVMQIIASPTVVADPRDQIIPMLISKSYNEGLSPADYWVSSYGTRKGTVASKLSVQPGGMMAKEVIGNVLDMVITMRDCGTKDGLEYLLQDPVHGSKDVLERYEAGTNRLIDARYYESLIKGGHKTVKVRSPIKCRAQHGICQLCYGHNERGVLPEIGENVGVQAAQAVTEPLTQMGLSSKHTAGTAAEEAIGLPTIQKFFQMTQYAGSAVVAALPGTVSRIEPAPAGGTDVYIGTKKHHIPPGRQIHVKVGDVVKAGDMITSGIPNLEKIVPHKGIDVSRELFVHHANDLYHRAGAASVRKNFETIARGMINYVQIEDPGDFDFVVGDIADYNSIKAEIAQHPEKKPPHFVPVQRGTTYAPQQRPDWLANFGFKYLSKTLLENVARGSKSELHSYHPVPGYAAAAEFGKGKDGRY
jgi:DNA-directed RNA polymerase subunit beta'